MSKLRTELSFLLPTLNPSQKAKTFDHPNISPQSTMMRRRGRDSRLTKKNLRRSERDEARMQQDTASALVRQWMAENSTHESSTYGNQVLASTRPSPTRPSSTPPSSARPSSTQRNSDTGDRDPAAILTAIYNDIVLLIVAMLACAMTALVQAASTDTQGGEPDQGEEPDTRTHETTSEESESLEASSQYSAPSSVPMGKDLVGYNNEGKHLHQGTLRTPAPRPRFHIFFRRR